MGNSQAKPLPKKEILQKLSNTQRGYIEAWYLVLAEEELRVIRKTVFIEDLHKRFANMPPFLLSAIFECMDPDSNECITENAFFFLTYIVLNGSFEEKCQLTYSILQRIGKITEVTVGSVLQFHRCVDTKNDEDADWNERILLNRMDIDYNASSDVIISWDRFYQFGTKYPNSPIIKWLRLFRKQIEDACILRQELADDESTGNAKLSKLFYTNRKNLIYSRIRDMSLSVLLEIYGILKRGSSQGYITKAQWISEISKFFSHDLTISIFMEFSGNKEKINIHEVFAAMCLLCRDPVDQRITASLHIFQHTRRSVEQFTHADLVQLFSSGVAIFNVDNSFDYNGNDDDVVEDSTRIHVRRRLSQDDSSHQSNVVYIVDAIFAGVRSSRPVHQRTISTADLIDWIVQHPNHYSFLTHQLRSDYNAPVTREDELKEYRRLYKEYNADILVPNELYFVIAKTWWSHWIQYINAVNADSLLSLSRPSQIDNSYLMEDDQLRLRSDLTEKKEYVILSEPLWDALIHWYGGGPIISRRVIRASNKSLELELYPLLLHICMSSDDGNPGEIKDHLLSSKVQTVKRVKNRVCQILDVDSSRCRLWILEEERDGQILLKDEMLTLEELELCEEPIVMVEMMDSNGRFYNRENEGRKSSRVNGVCGLVGIENLGNTCYLNAALQCICHTDLLKDYFISQEYIEHINTEGSEGLHGEFASAFGTLITTMWKPSQRMLAPRRFKNILCELQPQFQGYTQHDAQELLSAVLDGLCEDLNLAMKKPYVELSGEGCSESELAVRYWKLHCAREKNIITAIFCGQFKSLTQCAGCDHKSAKFDPFTILQLSLPKTEMRALSITISYSNGHVPVQCSLRVPADSTLKLIHDALNDLDPTFSLDECRIQLGRVEDSNVIEVYDQLFRLNACSFSDLMVFVLPPEKEILGFYAFQQFESRKMLVPNQQVRLLMHGDNGLPLTGIVRELFTDFYMSVYCSDGMTRELMIGDLDGGDQFMLQAGDFVFVENGSRPQKYDQGIYVGPSQQSADHYVVRLFPSEREVSIPLELIRRRSPKPKRLYVVQRYNGINDDYFLGYNTPVMVGVPQAIEIIPEFVTGRQLYNYLYNHFKKTISNPVTQTVMNTVKSSHALMPRVSSIPPELSRALSIHITAPVCSSFIDGDSRPFGSSIVDSSRGDTRCTTFSSDGDEEVSGRYYKTREKTSRRPKQGLEDETQWGYLKEGEIQSHISQLYGFVLKLVDSAGFSCISCHWLQGCTGCVISPDDSPLYCLSQSRKIAVDWDSQFLNNHYHQIMYENTITHSSVEAVETTGKQNILLQECLQNFVQTEILQGEQRLLCEKCKVLTNHYLSMQIWRPPPVLVIHLKRFQFTSRSYIKIQSNVEFPLTDMDLTDFVVRERQTVGKADTSYWEMMGGKRTDDWLEKELKEPTVSKEEMKWREFLESNTKNPIPEELSECTKYDLYGVINHLGQMEGGHYVSTILASDGKWYLINDSRFMPISQANVMSPNAYILFYVRQDVKDKDFRSLFNTHQDDEESVKDEIEELEDDHSEEKKKCCII